MVRWVVGSIILGVNPLSYFSFQPVLYDWCNKGRGMCYPVCGMVHIKEPLLLIDKSSSRGVVGLNLVLSDKVFFSVDSGSLGHAQSESGGCPVIYTPSLVLLLFCCITNVPLNIFIMVLQINSASSSSRNVGYSNQLIIIVVPSFVCLMFYLCVPFVFTSLFVHCCYLFVL